MKTNKRLQAAICPVAVLLLAAASLTSCSSEENLTDNTPSQGFQLKLNGYLENTATKTRGAGAQWEDVNGAAGDGLKFKWTNENTSEMYAGYFSSMKGMILPTIDGKYYSKINIAIDGSNSAKAKLSSETNFTPGDDFVVKQDIILCFAPIGGPANITQTELTIAGFTGVKNTYFAMSFPESFTQEEANSTKGINEHMYIYGQANQTNTDYSASDYNASDVDITFHHVPATVRYVIRNKQGETVTIKSVKMSFDSNVLPTSGQYRWYTTNNGQKLESSIYFDETRTNSVTTQFGTNGAGLSVDTNNPLLGYAVVAPSQETITGNATFTITDGDGREYVSDCFSAEDLLADVTKESKFKSGYVYTAWLLLDKNKLTLGGVTVNEWGDEVDGGEATNDVMSLTSWCSTDTYKAQRDALTELTLDGSTITATERDNYMQANFATYFPKVTTLNITGTSISQIQLLNGNKTVTTLKGENVTSLKQSAFESASNSGVTTYLFPNLETVGGYCFKRSGVTELSLPKLKAFSAQILFGVGVTNACFASLTNFTGASQEFSTSGINLAFGATTEFNFGTSKTPVNLFQSADQAGATTLYLNGYEYDNADKENNTWRGVTFAAIKKYSEYPGKKD